jgi:predicted nucleic acid-binding protein
VIPALVDSNVIIDVASGDAAWGEWSSTALERIASESILIVNPIIYGEVSQGYATIEELDGFLTPDLFRREPIPWPAAFLAGRCYLAYRRRGGLRRSPLPDFYIGAHAAVAGYRLLTRDATLYRTYFPTLELVAPDAAPG